MSASEDIRFQMALTAASRERANRPRALIVGAGALFVVAALIALVGLGARARAASGLRAEARRQGDEDRVARDPAADVHDASAMTRSGVASVVTTMRPPGAVA